MRIVVNDIAASKTGALAILQDFYEYVSIHGMDHEWIFLTGIDCLKGQSNIKVILRDDVKSSQLSRLKFDLISGSSFIESLEPDVVFSLQNTLTRGVIKKNGKRVPQVLYVHQPLGFQKTKRFSFFNPEEREYAVYQYLIGSLINASVRRASAVIVQTDWMKGAVAETTRISQDKIFKVLPDIPDLTAYRNGTWDKRRFFFPSGEILYKNHECVLKAAKILNDRGYTDFKIHFTLKGLSDVTSRQYDDPYENIVWSGRVSREEVIKEYATSTLLFPSYIETFGVPMAEARQIGTLILASDCPFSREVLEGYGNASFFDPFNEMELAELMQQVLDGKLMPTELYGESEGVLDSRPRKCDHNSYSEIVDIIISNGK